MIVSTINGDSNINFYNELAGQGITADTDPGRGRQRRRGRAARARPVEGQGTPGRLELLPEHRHTEEQGVRQELQGQVRPGPRHRRSDRGGLHRGLFLEDWRSRRPSSTDVDKVREAFKSNIEFEAPGGLVKLDPKTQHTYKRFLMGKIRDDKQFDVVYASPLQEPIPYPQVAFPGWGCDWTKGGVTKGTEVKILVIQVALFAREPEASPRFRLISA